MGKYLDKFKNKGKNALDFSKDQGKKFGEKINDFANNQVNKDKKWKHGKFHSPEQKGLGQNPNNFDDDFFDDEYNNNYDPYVENVQPAQKPASFHHFILEPKYQDLEKSIRGYKDVFNKDKQAWEIKRKKNHCFTDEESEEILRTAQSHLATDIKLTFYDKQTFGIRLLAIYDKLEFMFKRIMEYRFGRFGDYKTQGMMKEQALKIFVELITRIEANYLRALSGTENKRTHDNVRSQESLQGLGDDMEINRGYT